MNISVVIPTRGKEREAFVKHLTEHLLPYQTRQPDQVELIDYEPTSDQNDQHLRLAEGMSRVNGDLVLIMEDNDWYSQGYIQEISSYWQSLGKPSLIGYAETLYYHLKTNRYRKMHHRYRSSLFTTGMTLNVAQHTDWHKMDSKIDIRLWQMWSGQTLSHGFQWSAVGIKHGIGKVGGIGHREDFSKTYDKGAEKLMGIVDGESFVFYNSFE